MYIDFFKTIMVLSLFLVLLNISCRYEGEIYDECITILDCDEGFSCIDGECVSDQKDYSGEEEENNEENNELPENKKNNEQENETDEEDVTDEDITDEEYPDTEDHNGNGNGEDPPPHESFCTEEAECDEDSVCYNENNQSECVDPYKKFWKVTINTLCLSDKKPNGDNWDSGPLGEIDQPDPYAVLFINEKEVLRTSYADETTCAQWSNFSNIKFEPEDYVYVEMWEYDSMAFNDDDYAGTYEWTDGIPVEIFKAREFVFENPSNPGFTYLRITFQEMD